MLLDYHIAVGMGREKPGATFSLVFHPERRVPLRSGRVPPPDPKGVSALTSNFPQNMPLLGLLGLGLWVHLICPMAALGQMVDSSPRVGLAPFTDTSPRPTFLLNPESLQKSLIGILVADHDLRVTPLEPVAEESPTLFDPNTQLIPPEFRSGLWRSGGGGGTSKNWFDQAREKKLTVVVTGSYEVFEDRIRYVAEGIEPLARVSLFACRVTGATGEKFALEEELGKQIAEKLASERGSPEKPAVSPSSPPDLPPEPETRLSAEDHYENGFSLTRRYDQTKEMKYLQGAEEEYRAALALDPDHFRALNNLGTVLHRQGRYQEAIGYYHKVLEHDPHYVRAMENAALAYHAIGEDDAAIEMWRRSLAFEEREEVRKVIEETLDDLIRKKNAENAGQP